MRIASQGGPVRDIAQAEGRDLAWGASDVIVFGGQGKGLSQVSALGGPIRQVTELSGMEVTHDHQSFLPDGRRFFYMARRGSNAEDWDVYVGSIDSKKRHLIPGIHAAVKYASSGHLLFNRNGTETLVAQPFDLVQLRVTGEPFTVAEGRGGVSGANFATSENGSVAYIGIGKIDETTPTWVERSGRPIKPAGAPGLYRNLALSPNGAFIAFDRGGNPDIFVLEHFRGLTNRFTTNSAADAVPIWSPKSDAIAFLSSRIPAAGAAPNNVAGGNLYAAPFGFDGEERRLSPSESRQTPTHWSSDGRYLMYTAGGDIWALDMSAGIPKPLQLTNTPYAESNARISPNGRWIAYNSLKSETQEVVVRSFAAPGAELQVSTSGGFLPRWNSKGSEIFYLSPLPDSHMMAVSLKEDGGGGNLQLQPPVSLFPARLSSLSDFRSYDVAQDGRFLMNISTNEQTFMPVTVIHNWASSLRK